jgi:molybdopterin converting factor small subunit
MTREHQSTPHATVSVRFYGPLRQFVASEQMSHTLNMERTIRQMITDLGVPGDQLVYTMCLVNERRVPLDTPVVDGDQIDIFQPVAGG